MGNVLFRRVLEPLNSNVRLWNVIPWASHLVIGCFVFFILNMFYECDVEINELPRNIEPLAYDIELTPHLNNFTFTGKVNIFIKVKNDSNNITLNINNLNIKQVSLFKKNSKTELKDPDDFYDTGIQTNYDTKSDNPKIRYVNDFMIIYPTSNLKTEDKYDIRIEYEGYMNAKMEGLFGNSYYNHKQNKQIRYAVSNFYPNHARKVFPCFDESYFTSEFEITINAPTDLDAYTSLAHRTIMSTKSTKDTTSHRFLGSGKSSTQSIAIAILNSNDSKIDSNHKLWKCLSASTAVIVEKYHPMYKYPKMSKFDNIFIIYNTSGETLNHVGIITLSSSGDYYGGIYSFGDEYKTCLQVSYLVGLNAFMYNTLPIQGNEWLAKAFAQHVTNIVFKGNELDSSHVKNDDMFIYERSHALLRDGILRSLPTYAKQSEYQQKFIRNHLLYYKGNAVLKQGAGETILENMIRELDFNSPEPNMYDFQKLLTAVMRKNEKNTEVQRNSLFIRDNIQSGYPLVTINTTYIDGITKLNFKQEQFIYGNQVKSNDSWIWRIPAHYNEIRKRSLNLYSTSSIPIFLQRKEANIYVRDRKIEFVYRQNGYYRVNYDLFNWQRIIDRLCYSYTNLTTLSAVEKSQIIDDAFNLARAGYIYYKVPIGLMCLLKGEPSVSVIQTACRSMMYLLHIFERKPDLYKILQAKFDEAIPNTDILQESPIIFAATCEFGRTTSLNKTNNWFSIIQHNYFDYGRPISIPKSGIYGIPIKYLKIVLCIGIRNSDDKVFNEMLRQYFNTIYTEDKYFLIYGLSCTTKADLINRVLNRALYDGPTDKFRNKDIPVVIKRLSKSYIGRSNILLYLMKYFQNVVNRIGEKETVKMIKIVVQNLVEPGEIKNAKIWIKSLPDKIDPSNSLAYALDIAELNCAVFRNIYNIYNSDRFTNSIM